MANLTLHNTK